MKKNSELDKIEEYLKNNGYAYRRRPVFPTMPKGPEQIAVFDGSVQIWNVICDQRNGLLEYSAPHCMQGRLTAEELIGRIER